MEALRKAAKNVAGHVQRKETEMQGLLQLHAAAVSYQERGVDVDWATIKRAVMKSRPPFADSLDAMVAFVACRSGGLGGEYLQYLKSFHRLLVNPSVRSTLPAKVYAELAEFPYHYVALAIFQAAWTCPLEAVKNGLCSWISAAEIAGLRRNADPEATAKLQEIEAALLAARRLLPETGVSQEEAASNSVIAALARFDIMMARFALSKAQAEKHACSSVNEVAQHFINDFRAKLPTKNPQCFVELWPKLATENVRPTEVTEAAGSAIELYAVDSDGQVVHPRAMLRAKGFDFGATVDADGRGPHRIVGAGRDRNGAEVYLETIAASSPKQTKVPMDVFLAQWRLCDLKKVVEKHPGWPDCHTAVLAATTQTFQKGSALAALGFLTRYLEKNFPVKSKIVVLSKPSRRVLAAGPLPIGFLVLAPVTQGLKAIARKDIDDHRADPPAGAVEVTFQPPDAETTYWLTSATASDNVSPLFCVATTTDPEEANMEWRKYVVQQVAGLDFVGRPAPAGPPAKRLRLGTKTEAKEGEEEADNTYVSIPVLINTKALDEGEELRFYKASVEKKEKGPTKISITDLSKRAARRPEASSS
jgi:hypothetical protein